MNILGLSITRNAAPAQTKSAGTLSSYAAAWLRGDDLDQRPTTLSSPYEQVAWVYRAVNAIAEQIANIPFVFSRGDRGRENLISSGPLVNFYNRPHPHLNRFQYWELRVLWLMLRGESFRLPVFSDLPSPQCTATPPHRPTAPPKH